MSPLHRIALLCLSILLAGCATRRDPVIDDCPVSLGDALRKVNLIDVADRLVAETCVKAADNSDEVVLVPDFIDLQSYQSGHTGMLLGEVVRSRLSARCNYKIRQVELSKKLRLNEGGLSLLTRDVKDLVSGEVSSRRAFVGTFMLMPNKIMLSLRDLDLTTGTVDRIGSKEITYGCRSGFMDQGSFYSNVR